MASCIAYQYCGFIQSSRHLDLFCGLRLALQAVFFDLYFAQWLVLQSRHISMREQHEIVRRGIGAGIDGRLRKCR